jgi:2-polyprenyl-3-methyl-5-hydroxy-6-metoxy-1,4-benzoquinol methylase
MSDLTARASHFEFGENWLSFAREINPERISAAVLALERLFPSGELRGRRFLDIGCGSGLNMLAALKLGAAEVVGIDIDENSVKAARQVLSGLAAGANWQTSCASIFDVTPAQLGRFDVVYSWGVLHHTGNMWLAVTRAADLVAAGGLLAIAIYRKTMFCGMWKVEKRLYARMPRFAQAPVRWVCATAKLARRLLAGENPLAYVREYHRSRGMSWTHDVHDWLGGYPYESALADEVCERIAALGLQMVRQFGPRTPGIGLLGSGGCNEYVARRP